MWNLSSCRSPPRNDAYNRPKERDVNGRGPAGLGPSVMKVTGRSRSATRHRSRATAGKIKAKRPSAIFAAAPRWIASPPINPRRYRLCFLRRTSRCIPIGASFASEAVIIIVGAAAGCASANALDATRCCLAA
jgi:hypothetical protein